MSIEDPKLADDTSEPAPVRVGPSVEELASGCIFPRSSRASRRFSSCKASTREKAVGPVSPYSVRGRNKAVSSQS